MTQSAGSSEPARDSSVSTGQQQPEHLSVVVAMLTYLRPEGLDEALRRLPAQLESVDFDASILIVDNDPAGSAMSRASEFASESVRFVHEPHPGIAAARNRALLESGDKALLIFIDDDEQPQDGWLASLVDTWLATRACAVVGPVVSTFAGELDPWITAGEFFVRRRMPTGTFIEEAATNNLLLDLQQVRDLDLSFDEEFGISGGSDSMFTRELTERGGRMVWCDEAIVVDVVPSDRATREWVLRRRYRMGNGTSRVALALATTPTSRLAIRIRLTALGLARIVAGTCRQGLGILTRSLSHRAKGAKTLARGLGMVAGAWGVTYFEYHRKDNG